MGGNKAGRYQRVYQQLAGLLTQSNSRISRMATIAAVLHHKMEGFFWTGFYLCSTDQLHVGPYQGPLACQTLAKNNGVCWACINEEKAIVVPDVDQFPGHIACDSRSKSEIALPVRDHEGLIIAVLDIDSRKLDHFDETDVEALEKILLLL